MHPANRVARATPRRPRSLRAYPKRGRLHPRARLSGLSRLSRGGRGASVCAVSGRRSVRHRLAQALYPMGSRFRDSRPVRPRSMACCPKAGYVAARSRSGSVRTGVVGSPRCLWPWRPNAAARQARETFRAQESGKGRAGRGRREPWSWSIPAVSFTLPPPSPWESPPRRSSGVAPDRKRKRYGRSTKPCVARRSVMSGRTSAIGSTIGMPADASSPPKRARHRVG